MANSPPKLPDFNVGVAASSSSSATVSKTFVAGSEGRGKDVETGASVTSRYHNYQQDIVGVNVDDLRDFQSDSAEELLQFVVGEFFAAGSFWLGLERMATVTIWYKDALFWVCVVALIAGLVIGYFGYKQLTRRKTRIDRIIKMAMRERPGDDNHKR